MKLGEWGKKALKGWRSYFYVLAAALVGVVLLVWPTGEKGEQSAALAGGETASLDSSQMEEKIERALSRIQGAGEVTVVLTLDTGPRRVLAQDGKSAQGTDKTERSAETVLVSAGSGVQQPVELQTAAPVYRGALVVASGGDDAQVRLAISEAVSALTGLGADKISICKGK